MYMATDNDRLKLLVLYCGEDDERLRKAASGMLAVLTGEMPELCSRIPGTVSTGFCTQSKKGSEEFFEDLSCL